MANKLQQNNVYGFEKEVYLVFDKVLALLEYICTLFGDQWGLTRWKIILYLYVDDLSEKVMVVRLDARWGIVLLTTRCTLMTQSSCLLIVLPYSNCSEPARAVTCSMTLTVTLIVGARLESMAIVYLLCAVGLKMCVKIHILESVASCVLRIML